VTDPVLDALRPYLAPHKTLIDVGAGTGARAATLAAELDWVTVVEPATELRELIPDAANMTVIASSWEDAEVQPADLVLCGFALDAVAEPASFLEKLERAATERVFVTVAGGLLDVLASLGVRAEVAGGVAHWRPRAAERR
jgi:NAD(P)H-hydrate repair Nnr-like enzyme with NAD(P)H-hydrate dehydratase domain